MIAQEHINPAQIIFGVKPENSAAGKVPFRYIGVLTNFDVEIVAANATAFAPSEQKFAAGLRR